MCSDHNLTEFYCWIPDWSPWSSRVLSQLQFRWHSEQHCWPRSHKPNRQQYNRMWAKRWYGFPLSWNSKLETRESLVWATTKQTALYKALWWCCILCSCSWSEPKEKCPFFAQIVCGWLAYSTVSSHWPAMRAYDCRFHVFWPSTACKHRWKWPNRSIRPDNSWPLVDYCFKLSENGMLTWDTV